MQSPQPILYVFAISHYCEKARWALDHGGIAYRLHHTMPGLNRRIAKKLGASAGSLPFLATPSGAIAGSSAIMDWAEANRSADSVSLTGNDPEAARAVEQRLDEVTGVHVRCFYYSDALFSDPQSVRPIFSRGLPLIQRMAVTLGWSQIVPRMIAGMNLGPDQGKQSGEIVRSELDWLDGLLADGRPYLGGDCFSRADMTAASLLAPLASPPEHPTYASITIPDGVGKTMAEWSDRPIMNWVRAIYARHR